MEAAQPMAARSRQFLARAKEAEEWAAKTTDLSLRQGWLKIAEGYRLLAEHCWRADLGRDCVHWNDADTWLAARSLAHFRHLNCRRGSGFRHRPTQGPGYRRPPAAFGRKREPLQRRGRGCAIRFGTPLRPKPLRDGFVIMVPARQRVGRRSGHRHCVAVAALLVAGRTRDHLVETAVTTVAAYGAFLLADDLHVSGVLAPVFAGLVFGTIGLRAGGRRLGLSRQGQAFVLDLWEFLAFIANSVVFLLIGVSISRMHFQDVGYGALALLILLVQVGRAATVYPLGTLLRSSRRAIPMREQHVLSWGGLRGALALALALSLPDTFPIRDAVVVSTFGVVAFSVIVQGLTLPALIRALKLMPMSDNKKQNF